MLQYLALVQIFLVRPMNIAWVKKLNISIISAMFFFTNVNHVNFMHSHLVPTVRTLNFLIASTHLYLCKYSWGVGGFADVPAKN